LAASFDSWSAQASPGMVLGITLMFLKAASYRFDVISVGGSNATSGI
jgi:hypothetical protein